MFSMLPSTFHFQKANKEMAENPEAQKEAAERRDALEAKILEHQNVLKVVEDCVKDIKTFRACCI